ncbi:hypothetical protein [Devosia sp. SD17-2]|uniref:hypothetical protein n=1 Tax=Devosia sp. SD17-2 TaxID=2976459 RepID=UPI0023D80412|nr:hypothetical protein [Devosia sp. SD17-2]WEJ33869.1 hypothetical protein NYQ88_03380 [Devosia sp. SD17-2]
MLVRNKETGAVETLRHGPATDAVAAGTHAFVNLDETGESDDAGAGDDKKPKPAKTAGKS